MRSEKDRRSGRGRPDLSRYYVQAILGGRKNASLFCGCLSTSLHLQAPSPPAVCRGRARATLLPQAATRRRVLRQSSYTQLEAPASASRAERHSERKTGKPVPYVRYQFLTYIFCLFLLVAHDKLSTTTARSIWRQEKGEV